MHHMINKESTHPSSLIAAHQRSMPDPLHEMQLLRDLKRANEGTVRELGPLPPGGWPVISRHKPKLRNLNSHQSAPISANSEDKSQEDETMKLTDMIAATAVMALGIAACNPTTETTTPAPKAAATSAIQTQDPPHLLIMGAPGNEPPSSWDESSQPRDAIEPELPPGFDSFGASTPIGDNRYCAVGAIADEDGMNHRPYVYIADASGKRIGWVKPLNVPRNFYESVAERCLRKGTALYVLQSSNTLMQASLSQALLRLVKLNLATGHIDASADIEVPGVGGSYSTWVDKEPNGLISNERGIVVSGEYFFHDDGKSDQHFPFKLVFDDNLAQLK